LFTYQDIIMPELPEVEVSRLGITPWMEGVVVEKVVIRHPRLRWPIPSEIHLLEGQPLHSIERRAKYLLLRSTLGTAILHLGMSGHLRILPIGTPAEKHDHVDLELANGKLLRFHDPRRFGALLWTTDDPHQHPLLKSLGPEPLTDAFTPIICGNAAANRAVRLNRG
jgi:DNA-(apurinic or apyrimidinic site) lyase (EC 4.2.99.18)/Formamidopyrimidine-DNA glycosylase (EC 3.2.2.23)